MDGEDDANGDGEGKAEELGVPLLVSEVDVAGVLVCDAAAVGDALADWVLVPDNVVVGVSLGVALSVAAAVPVAVELEVELPVPVVEPVVELVMVLVIEPVIVSVAGGVAVNEGDAVGDPDTEAVTLGAGVPVGDPVGVPVRVPDCEPDDDAELVGVSCADARSSRARRTHPVRHVGKGAVGRISPVANPTA